MTSSSPLIDTPAALEDLVAQLAGDTAIGMDTEFLRERTYRAELCLIAGEDPPPYKNGLPVYVRIKGTTVKKKLPPFKP